MGDIFGRHGLEPPAPSAPPAADAHALARDAWGRFVAIWAPAADGPASAYRDPSGAFELHAWSLAPGLHVLTSDFSRAPAELSAPHAYLNWDRIGAFVVAPQVCTTAPLMDGIVAAGPGECIRLSEPPSKEAVWRPADYCAPHGAGPRDLETELVRRVDVCTAALVRSRKVVLELSGGLDSAIVAGSLAAQGLSPRAATAVYFDFPRPEADERRFAAAVALRAALSVEVRRWVPGVIDEADLKDLADGPWPAVMGVDARHDRTLTDILVGTGSDAVLSGQGGDGVFFQMPSALIVADGWRTDGMGVFVGPLLPNVARRLRTSIWSVLRQAARGVAAAPPNPISSLTTDALRRAVGDPLHAWTTAARGAGLPPGKQLHIEALANTQTYNGGSRAARVADHLFPLAAQPVVELALGVPTPLLAGASYDRPFARAAFRDRIPQAIYDRNVKGSTTAYFQQLVAQSREALEPFLVDGVLADAGVLDRGAVAQALDPGALISGAARGADVMWAAAVEAWVRHWQTRTADAPGRGRR
ncbi:asparagine synthase-related protein [Phenylobacterium sp. VNQ135]|uniref:asparagine synthase-related protein n=1 Tax=Phenylobacterium sp. VNQ135 TaxID=3400922 RepID=UPI003BFD21AF